MMESMGRTLQTRELDVLLRDVVEQRHGASAATVVASITRLRAPTLHQLCTDVASAPGLDKVDEVRRLVATLMKHEAVSHDEGAGTYSPNYGLGILPVFFPLVAKLVTDNYPHTAEHIARVLFQYHDLPVESIVREVLRVQPDVEASVRRALDSLINDGLLASAGGGSASSSGGEQASPAGKVSGQKRSAGNDAGVSMQFNWPIVLARLRVDRIRNFASVTFGATAGLVSGVFLAADANRPGGGRSTYGFPRLHLASSPLTIGAVQRKSGSLQPSTVIGTVDALVGGETAADSSSILQPVATGSTNESSYTLSYLATARAMQRELCEGIVLSRHGVVGARIMRLLGEHEAMEDKFIAEEALVTHADARTVLTAMLRDGFVRLLELPKGNMADRVVKHSIFLWTLAKDQLLETVQVHVVKALCNARAALQQEISSFRHTMPPAFFEDPHSTVLSEAEAKRATAHDVQRTALEHAIAALLERVLVVLYF